MNLLINNFKWCLVIIGGFVLVIAFLSGGRYLGKASVEVVRIPDGARMPRAVIDESGTMHVIYFEGVMSGGDLFYVSRGRGHDTWSAPMLVNREPRSVVGMGPIDGGQLAIDSRNVIHVVWFQTNPTRIFYTRSQQNTDLFETQRMLWTENDGSFEASPTVATDLEGNVFALWHAGGSEDYERGVHLVVSRDEGRTFGQVQKVSKIDEGACGCCNMAALTGLSGEVYVSYRSAAQNIRRGQRLLTLSDAGRRFDDQLIHEWEIGACPVTTTTLSNGPEATKIAWETDGQVYFASVDRLDVFASPQGTPRFRRKNPVVAVNQRSQTLLAWGDGPGLRAGGTLHWSIFDSSGRQTNQNGDGPTVPSGSAPAVIVQPDDSFTILY